MEFQSGKAQYFAFISHKSSDSRFSLKLQKFIESYNLPTEVRRSTKSPKRLTPICSYELDFLSNPLYDEMTDKLRSSQYLIVLCSEELIRSGAKYINYEIETFIKLKSDEGIDPLKRIIPIILSGAFDDPDHECCPDALKALGEKCPIAIDRRKYKNDRDVFLHVISGMLDIDYAVLENRDRKRRLRGRVSVISACLAAVIISIGALDYYIPKTHHYRDFVFQNGIPVGINELSKKEYQSLHTHYVITEQQRRITELELVNSYGKTVDHDDGWLHGDRPARYVFNYVRSELSSVTFYNASGIPLCIQQYSGAGTVDIKNPYDPSRALYLNKNFESNLAATFVSDDTLSTNVSRFAYQYDESGHVIKITYHTDSSNNLGNSSGIYGIEYELDDKGRVIEKYFLDANGDRRANTDGVFCMKYEYDSSDRILSYKCYGRKGELVPDAAGIYHMARTYDKNGNVASIELFDAEGSPLLVPKYNSAKQLQTFDDRGNRQLILYYNEDGEFISQDGVCGIRFTYDENGFNVGRVYLDKNQEPVGLTEGGVAYEYYSFDRNGNLIEERYCDQNGDPVNSDEGFSKVKKAYNENGLVTGVEYFDKDGKGADYCGYGYSSVVYEYDDTNYECLRAYYGPNGEAVNLIGHPEGYGYHRREIVLEYKGSTKTLSVKHYDKSGDLVNLVDADGNETYAKKEIVIQAGELTASVYYTADGELYDTRLESVNEYTPYGERVNSIHMIDGGDRRTYTLISKYDSRGVLKEKEQITYHSDGRITARHISLYDSSGILDSTDHSSYNEDGTTSISQFTEYSEDGSILSEKRSSFDETLTEKLTVYGDSEITVTISMYYGADASSPLSIRLVAKYDLKGNLLSEELFMYDIHGNEIKQ